MCTFNVVSWPGVIWGYLELFVLLSTAAGLRVFRATRSWVLWVLELLVARFYGVFIAIWSSIDSSWGFMGISVAGI